ncbi:hypothetical protein D3C86_1962050 [compost metagenome]
MAEHPEAKALRIRKAPRGSVTGGTTLATASAAGNPETQRQAPRANNTTMLTIKA